LAKSGLAEEIVLIDKNHELALGQALDLAHGLPFFPAVKIKAGNSSDYSDSSLIVITAGVAQKPGETRLQLLEKNAAIVQDIIKEIELQNSKAVIVMVTNPVDIMTYVATKNSKLPKTQIIGSGTVLDSARLRYFLSSHCSVDVHNVHAYVLGEHGDSEFAAWSMTHVAGMPMSQYCPLCRSCADWQVERKKIEKQVRDSAYHIIGYKGATYYGISMALVRISSAILRGEKSVLTVSTFLNGEYGLKDVCLSVPCIVSNKGVSRIIENKLTDEEIGLLTNSANILKKSLSQLRNMK
ncbi:MAG TPA: L-lactate dehydrogenase, partial [Victivallales bacterium]|nr:L-lactate dehydrogenase [Victivallales bacterium]